MPELPDDGLTAELVGIWSAALDAALSPDFVGDDEGRERYRRNVLRAARGRLMSLRPDRAHPAVGGPAGRVVSCTLCGMDSTYRVHLSDAGVDLRRVVVGAAVVLSGRPDGELVAGRVVRMDTLTLGVVDVEGAGRGIFSAHNVVNVVRDAAEAQR